MKQRKTFSEWLTHYYLLIIRNEENFQDVRKIRFNYAKLIVIFAGVFIIMLAPAIGAVRLWDSLISKSDDVRANQVLELALQVDSLEQTLATQEAYYSNIKNLLQGNIQQENLEEKEEEGQKVSIASEELDEINEVDSVFRKEFEETDHDLNILANPTKEKLQHIVFFPPVEGVITKRFDVKAKHIAVDIAARKNEPIKATTDGTVIMASWTQDAGYVIGIQHKNQLISFYKHNSVLLKEVGDYVKAGEPVAIIGNSGEYTDGQHLHFEIWYNGDPVNPETFVQF